MNAMTSLKVIIDHFSMARYEFLKLNDVEWEISFLPFKCVNPNLGQIFWVKTLFEY